MSVLKWFERKFDFSFDLDEYTAIYQRLQQAPAKLVELLQNEADDTLSHQPAGNWSVKEHTGHLSVLEPLWRVRMHDILAKKPSLTPTDLNNSVTTGAGFNRYSIPELLQKFTAERNETIRLLDSIDIKTYPHTSLHPRMQKPMRLIDIAYFTAEHD
ncbi:MAG TPA: DinB family protein, partial [Niastella sp.]|nr:DinB family protein [Niastella sp.]